MERNLAEFDNVSNVLLNIIMSEEIEASKRGKYAAKIIGIHKKVESDDFIPSPCAKKILANYRVRRTKDEEQRRKQNYINDFNYKDSEAFKIISAMSKHTKDDFVKRLIVLVVEAEGKHEHIMKPSREVYRSKPALYKFIQDNIDIFKMYFDAGTKIEAD